MTDSKTKTEKNPATTTNTQHETSKRVGCESKDFFSGFRVVSVQQH